MHPPGGVNLIFPDRPTSFPVPAMTAAIALVSGGLDSCVALAEALLRRGGEVAVLHAGYGQRTEDRERRAFAEIADHYGLGMRREVDLRYLRDLGGSSLTDPTLPIPGGDHHDSEVPGTYVPFRNASLLSAAVAWAEVLGAGEVYCGAHSPGSPYPDTRPAFFRAFGRLVRAATPASVEIEVRTPLLHLDKAAIVRRGVTLEAPLHLTWSCYRQPAPPCGACHSCLRRSQGFAAAGIPDPLES